VPLAQPVVTSETIDRLEVAQTPHADEQVPEWLHELESQVSTTKERAEGDVGTDARAELAQDSILPASQEPAARLDSDQADLQPGAVDEDLPFTDEESPDWLLELQAEPVTEVTVEDMPDLLEQLRPGEAAQVVEPVPEQPEPEQEMAWLRDLEEMVVPEPVEAQGEIPSLQQVVESHAAAVTEPATEPDLDTAASAPQPDQVMAPAQNMEHARAYLEQGALDEAAEAYEHLVTTPSLREDVVHDLEQAVQTFPQHHALHRVLGDAYMHSGQLQKALAAYQEALTKL
jgi:tetratricopeptide (TPR) repeat protein